MAQPDEDRWPSRLVEMKAIDDLLRCGICFDYFNIAMIIPQCSHNYCSLCIRKFLSYKTQCPTCCVTVTEPDLKNNRVLDELVKSFSSARNHMLRLTLDSPPMSPLPSCKKNIPGKIQVPKVSMGSSLRQENRMMDSFLIKEINSSLKTPEKPKRVKESKINPIGKKPCTVTVIKEIPSEATEAQRLTSVNGPEKPSTSGFKEVIKVECPVCSVSIPEAFINKHLDSCLSREDKKDSLRSSVNKRKTMPKVVYNLLSDRDLRKKLKEHGLSSQGNKQQLIRRHQEFVHMYNAQCDSLHPKSVAEIVKEIENMEKTRVQLESNKLNENVMVFTKNQTEKEIDDIHSKYRKEHQNEFKLLVDEVKSRCKKSGILMTKEIKQEVEESMEEVLPVTTGGEDSKPMLTDLNSATVQLSQSNVESQMEMEMEQDKIDCSSNLPDVQEIPLSTTSDSGSSSSSDIIRDLIEEKEFLATRGRNQSKKMATRKACRSGTPENNCSNRRSKRIKN
ncbi:E3 ubiquitin-protein ligase RAD18 isoform X1 [Antechinus flavipes]|uniref:E3 ubiquitin-protein ligase RAD18 isoform X1 n=1 Tax=Antechinus flavipes TaxID=38775 RepID=UPI0022363142|nr:E3 ubiquitin-protein ligase RAD18 isoform X1 [Antechinus flavipes]